MTEINKLPIPKLKKLARELGVDPKQSIPKLRKAVAAVHDSAEASAKKTPAKAASKKAPAKKAPSRRRKPKAKEEPADDSKLDEVLAALGGIAGKLSDFDERLTQLEGSDEDEEFEDEEDEDEDDHDGANGHDDDVPAEVKQYLVEGEDGEFELDISSEDVDEMDLKTLKAVLGVLGEDVGKTRSVRKLQAKLRELIADADDDDDEPAPAPKKSRRKGKPKSKKLTEVPEVGTKVMFTDEAGSFEAYIVDEETFGEEADADNLEDGEDCFVAFEADPDSFMPAALSDLSLR